MPYGTITSTENTFGTVNGAVSGTVEGTLTGSVGVPGPVGPTGPQGIQGPPGPPGVGGTWGSITGTLSSQTDLQTALDGKYSTTNPSGFITSSALSPYLLSATASTTYYPLTGNPSGFLTSASLSGYATESWVTSQGYITSSALVPYLLSSTAASTYQPISGMSSYLTTSAAASTYATIAQGQPASGTIGQVLTKNSGTNYDSSWQTLIPGDRYLTTSSTSNSIGNGAKTFTVGTGLSYSSQQDVVISFDASNHMHALVTSYNSGTGVLVVDVQHHTGSGTYSVWTVNVGGTTPQASIVWGDITGTLGNQTDLSTALNAKLDSTTAASTYAPIASPTFTGTVTIPSGASIAGFAPLASPALTGNVTINSNSTGAALFIEQLGTGNILTLHDQATDTSFIAIDANGKINTVAPDATIGAGFKLPHGTAPTTPVNGDLWTATSGLFARINGANRQYVDFDGTQTINGTKTFSAANQTLGNSTATGTINVASGATISASTKTVNVGTGGVVGSTTNITVGPVLGASTTSIGGTTAASTLNLATGATLTATTKAVNIGTSGVAGSTTNITIGSTTGTSTTTLQGITNGVTEAVDTNNTELATTAFVVGQAGSATPLVNGTAAVGTSLRYARQDHVHGTDTTRAPLDSPAFTGTPSLPTGTIAVTQAIGTSTTALATTEALMAAMMANEWRKIYPNVGQWTATNTGTGASTEIGMFHRRVQVTSGNTASSVIRTGVAGTQYNSFFAINASSIQPSAINWSKVIRIKARAGWQNATTTNFVYRLKFGQGFGDGTKGDLTASGIGLRKSSSKSVIELCVHNGTTLTTVDSSHTVAASSIFDWEIVSNGSGTVTLFVNGSQVATTTAGPTSTNNNISGWQSELDSTVSGSTPVFYDALGQIYVQS